MVNRYAIILNFETCKIDAIDLQNKPHEQGIAEYIEETLGYSLSNCEWMTTDSPFINLIN
jgi:hypothetical protein